MENPKLQEENLNEIVSLEELFRITEAKINQKTRTVEGVILRNGWSLNRNYYNKSVVENLAVMITNDKTSRRMFDGHAYNDHEAMKRTPADVVARIKEAKASDGVCSAEIEVFEEPDRARALWERIVKTPEDIGLSIDAQVKIEHGKAEDGQEGTIIKEWVKLNSVDFVLNPSAGGTIVSEKQSQKNIGEKSKVETEDKELEKEVPIVEGPVADEINDIKLRDKFNNTIWAIESAIRKVLWDDDLTWDGKKETIKEALDETKTLIDDIDTEVEESLDENSTLGHYLGITGKVITKESKEGEKEIMDLKTLKEQHPELVEDILKESKTTEEVDGLKKENDKLVKESTDKDTKITDLEKKISDFENEKTKAEFKNQVDALLKESEIPDEFLTESFKNKVYEGKDIEVVKLAIEEHKNLIETIKKSNVSVPPKKNLGVITETEEDKKTDPTEPLVKSFGDHRLKK